MVSTIDHDPDSLIAKARGAQSTDGRDLASQVSCEKPYAWSEEYHESYPNEIRREDGPRKRVVAYDLGVKRNILRSLAYCGFDVTVVPAWTPAEDVLQHDPDGVFLSNGPGDPAAVGRSIDAVADLIGKKPIFGICLGHQILSIVLGAKTREDALRPPRREPPGARHHSPAASRSPRRTTPSPSTPRRCPTTWS